MLALGLYLVPIKNEINLSDAYYIFFKSYLHNLPLAPIFSCFYDANCAGL